MRFEECRRAVEFRAAEETNDGHTLEGYAAVFGQDIEINSWEGHFTERIEKGAFRKTLRERKPIMQYDHGRDTRVGSVPIGVYEELREDDHGLYVRGRVFDNDVVEPVRQAIEGGAITGMSFKFRVTRDVWRDAKGKTVRGDEIMKLLYEPGDRGPLVRTVKEVQLSEAGPVASPAYGGTSIGMRSLAEMSDEDREALAAEYRKTMIEVEEDYEREQAERFPEGELQRWLDAENTHNWLEAEKRYHEDVSAWLDAEQTFSARGSIESEKQSRVDDAGPETTSRTDGPPSHTPEADAARTGTSSRGSEVHPPLIKKEKSMTLDELRTRLAEIDARFEELGEETRDAELSEEAQKEWDALEGERGKVEKSIERIEKRLERMAALAETPGHTEHDERKTPAFHKDKDIYDLESLRKESYSADDFVERARENAREAVGKLRFPANSAPADKVREGFESMLDNRDSVDGELAKRILVTGSPTYERAFGKVAIAGNTNPLNAEEARALALGVDANGGFAVPVQLDPTLIQLGSGYISPLRQLARKVTLVGKEWQMLTISEVSVYRALEATYAPDTTPTITQQAVKVNKVHGFIPFSIEIEQDWPQLRSEMTDLLNRAKAKEEATAFLTGNGTAPNPQGLITGATTTVTGTGGGNSINAGLIYALEEALPVEFRDNASFLANKNTYNKIRQLDTAGGANLWVRIGDKTPNQLIGYPAYEVSGMAATGTAGNKILVFGDFDNFVIVDRIGMSIELIPMLFDQANGNRPTGQRGFYATWRNNSKVVNPDAFRVLVAAA